jgi:hypothetical protein
MSEGNALWRRFWHPRLGANQDDLRRAAWACVTAAASFCWNGHASEDDLVCKGSEGIPFDNPACEYEPSAKYIDILTDTMNNEVLFYRMTPQDSLLSGHDDRSVWCMGEPGQQYLVFSAEGKSFTLNVASGQYNNNIWLDTKTGNTQNVNPISGGGNINFSPPDTSTDWILILR